MYRKFILLLTAAVISVSLSGIGASAAKVRIRYIYDDDDTETSTTDKSDTETEEKWEFSISSHELSDLAMYCGIIPDFDSSTVRTQGFIRDFIMSCYSEKYISGGAITAGSEYQWKEDDVKAGYKLLFGYDMQDYHASITIDREHSIRYTDSSYFVGKREKNTDLWMPKYILEDENGFTAVFELCDENEIPIKDESGSTNMRICTAELADNRKGYVITSMGAFQGMTVIAADTQIAFSDSPINIKSCIAAK